jgi:hypothetical protein
MKFMFLDWSCGSGKTDTLLSHIAANPGLYIVALNKIDFFSQRQSRLATLAGQSAIQTQVIHSKDGVKGLNVAARITDFIQTTTARHSVLFITQEALFLVDWKRPGLDISQWHLFIDEAPNPWKFHSKSFEVSRPDVLGYFNTNPDPGDGKDFIRIGLSQKGEALRASKNDAVANIINEFLKATAGCRKGYANKSFFGLADNGRTSSRLEVFSIIDPEMFSGFADVTILAANFQESLLHLIWGASGVEFEPRHDFGLEPPRPFPLRDRIRIYYFSDKDASLRWFNDKADPLKVACEWVNANLEKPFYYTINNEKQGRLDRINTPLATKIQPISAGSNELREFTAAVWFAALKASPQEYVVMDYFGIDRDQYDRFREHEYLYQFALRSNLRNFNSDQQVDIYVISKRQAEALQAITEASSIVKVDCPLPEPEARLALPSGRPKKYKTEEERRAAKRERDRARLKRIRKNQ